MIVTRESINKDIIFRDGTDLYHPYTYVDLSKQIDAYKNLLEHKYNACPGKSVLIGEQSGKTQLALVFACLELGLTITIVDYGRKDDFQKEFTDSKTLILLPIDYFILSSDDITSKFKFFDSVCGCTILLKDECLDYTPNENIYCTPDTLLLKCTTSGTTGTPKIVEHTHRFIAALVDRNSKFFSGVIGQAFNLSHGSSLATFFLPTLFSPTTTDYINFQSTAESMSHVISKFDIQHLMLPYPDIVDTFLTEYSKVEYSAITLYTLTYIREEWLAYYDSGKVKDIISIFGSNETSGPILINKASDANFQVQHFYAIDDFYELQIDKDILVIKLPYYDKAIRSNDIFLQINNIFRHIGRNDLCRLNGSPFRAAEYQKIANDIINSTFIFDFVRHKIYLAVWEDVENFDEKVEQISNELYRVSTGAHRIAGAKRLSYSAFVSGIKLDQELLRDYFRYHV